MKTQGALRVEGFPFHTIGGGMASKKIAFEKGLGQSGGKVIPLRKDRKKIFKEHIQYRKGKGRGPSSQEHWERLRM